MPGVVSDTGPLRYLLLIGCIDLLPRLFGAVAVPATVAGELRHPGAPPPVRGWIDVPPPWLVPYPDPVETAASDRLDPGERAAIALARALGAELLLMDDRAGVAAGRQLGLRVTGTLGVLAEAASLDLVDLSTALAALQASNFRYPPTLLDAVLGADRARRGKR